MKLSKAGTFLLFVEELRTGHKVALGALGAAGVAGIAALAHHHGYQAGSAAGGSVGREILKGVKDAGRTLGGAAKGVGLGIGGAVRDVGRSISGAANWVGDNPGKVAGGLGAAAYYIHHHGGLGKTIAGHQNDIESIAGQTKDIVKGIFHGAKNAPSITSRVGAGAHNFLTREMHSYHATRAAELLKGAEQARSNK